MIDFKGANVRAVTVDDEPWFIAKGVCDTLGIKKPTQALQKASLDDEFSILNIGKGRRARIISESGLYAVILNSRKPEAKNFRKWVTGDAYMTAEAVEKTITDPDYNRSLL